MAGRGYGGAGLGAGTWQEEGRLMRKAALARVGCWRFSRWPCTVGAQNSVRAGGRRSLLPWSRARGGAGTPRAVPGGQRTESRQRTFLLSGTLQSYPLSRSKEG